MKSRLLILLIAISAVNTSLLLFGATREECLKRCGGDARNTYCINNCLKPPLTKPESGFSGVLTKDESDRITNCMNNQQKSYSQCK